MNDEHRNTCDSLIDRLTRSRRCILQISAQVTTFLTAGYETTASTLACTIYNISANPAVEAKVLQEIDGFGRNFVPMYEDLDKVGSKGCAWCISLRSAVLIDAGLTRSEDIVRWCNIPLSMLLRLKFAFGPCCSIS